MMDVTKKFCDTFVVVRSQIEKLRILLKIANRSFHKKMVAK